MQFYKMSETLKYTNLLKLTKKKKKMELQLLSQTNILPSDARIEKGKFNFCIWCFG